MLYTTTVVVVVYVIQAAGGANSLNRVETVESAGTLKGTGFLERVGTIVGELNNSECDV
jgi:hypothetical protein